ncbi:hypothetical protein QBC34DRAFT_211012 [Podospora aff. communis PSN243]|uniref:Inosine/uridine-preferring nucleoside hydrolase domain-containing protein n=1 Tax=Podospora aff. communis PSN243 TaxID=3040156 RepID=A0AAV9G7W9_9PEZI|nr:hypothetical protein QBC34DRAFT_211012 [Podospora aff. communis PSN243]
MFKSATTPGAAAHVPTDNQENPEQQKPEESSQAPVVSQKKFEQSPRLRKWEERIRPLIPYSKADHPEEYETYEKLIPVLAAREDSDVPRIVVVTDVELDYDDLLAIIFLSEMHRLGAIKLAGLIANHGLPLERAKFLRTVMHLLGLGHIEVAKGTYGMPETKSYYPGYYELKNETFKQQEWNNKPFRSGRDLLERLAKEVDEGEQPLTVLLISSLQDISEFFRAHEHDPKFLQTRFKKFVSQGGYIVKDEPNEQGYYDIEPMLNVANNTANIDAAIHYTRCLSEFGLPSDAWSREAAKAAPLEGTVFTEGSKYGPIGAHLSWLYERQEFKFFWDPFNAPFIPRLDNYWYLTTRCIMDPTTEKFAAYMKSPPPFHEILPQTKAIAYDGCAAMGAVGDDVMQALGIMGDHIPVPEYNKKRHRIFGRAVGDLGGVNGRRLGDVLQVFLFGALRHSKDAAEALIPSDSVRHLPEEYANGLDVFEKQVPHLKRSQEIVDEKKQGVNTHEKELERLQTGMIEVDGREYPMIPNKAGGIPYELLYQQAKDVGDKAAEARQKICALEVAREAKRVNEAEAASRRQVQ